MGLLVTWFLSEIADNLNARIFRAPRGELDSTGELSLALASLSDHLGIQGRTLLGSVLDDLLRPQNAATLAQAKEQRDAGEYHPYTLELRHSNAESVPVTVVPRPIYLDGKFIGSTAVLIRHDTLASTMAQHVSGARGPHCALVAESEQHRRQRRYNMAAEAGRVGVWELDIQSGAMFLDNSLKQLLGYESQEIADTLTAWSQLIHPDDKKDYLQKIQARTNNTSKSFENEHRMLHKDGQIIWVLSRGSYAAGADGNTRTVIGTDLDITALKLAEQAIERERQRLYDVLEQLPAFVCLIAPDYSVRFANKFFKEEFNTLDIVSCTHNIEEQDEPEGLCPSPDLFDTQFLAVWEWECPANNKTFRVFGYPFQDLDGTSLILELGIDITQSKRAQEALRASEELYRSISNNLALGIGVMDKELRINSSNKKLSEWFATLDKEPSVRLDMLFRHGTDTEQSMLEACELVFDKGTVQELQLSNATTEREQLFRVLFCPLFNEPRQVTAIIVLAEDITEKMLVEKRLARSQKLEALGTLAGGIAHEINQPLNALRLYASGLEMLLEEQHELSNETLCSRLAWILKEADKIRDIITHMRTLVHQGDNHAPGTADINNCVRQALSLLKAQLAAHGISLHLELGEKIPPVVANPVQLEQVIINLAVNAMQAMDTCNVSMEDEKILTIETRHKNNYAQLLVVDNGPGLTSGEERIFDPFFTSKEPGMGMGMGLTIVHTFVTAWKGDIRFWNNASRGATFCIHLNILK